MPVGGQSLELLPKNGQAGREMRRFLGAVWRDMGELGAEIGDGLFQRAFPFALSSCPCLTVGPEVLTKGDEHVLPGRREEIICNIVEGEEG
jgi:hypothetical protein